MTKKQEDRAPQPIGEDEILRRMLNTPPKQHEKKPEPKKPAPKPAA